MAPRWSLDGSIPALPDEDSCSSSIASGLSSRELQDGLIDQRDEEENSLSSSISSTHHRKHVVFQESATVYLYENDLNRQDAHESTVTSSSSSSSSSSGTHAKQCSRYCGWYSNAELRNFKMDVFETVDRIIAGEIGGGDSDFCSRGCEYRTPIGTVLRNKHRRDGLEAVLGYQLEQRRRGKEVDPDLLARIYSAVTRNSQAVAHVMGNIDQSSIVRESSSSSTVTSDIDASVSNRVSHGVTFDCSKLELEQLQQTHRLSDKGFFQLPSPAAFALRKHAFHGTHTQSG